MRNDSTNHERYALLWNRVVVGFPPTMQYSAAEDNAGHAAQSSSQFVLEQDARGTRREEKQDKAH